MAEYAFKIISLVFEDAGPDGGADHGHGALILIDLPMDDRPARDFGEDLCQLVERPTATSEVVASAKLIFGQSARLRRRRRGRLGEPYSSLGPRCCS